MKIKVAFTLALTVAFIGIIANHAEAGKSKPDLIVSAVSAPSSASPGETIVVSGTIKNQGKAGSAAFTVAAYLSASPSNTTGATFLGTQTISGLPAGASVTLAGSLAMPGTTTNGTFYVVAVADSAKVISESDERNNTRASGAIAVKDTTPPTISAVNATGITANSATTTWMTDKSSTSQVEFGTTTAYGSMSSLDTTKATGHTVTLSGLAPKTVYHFRVQSKDATGNTAISNDYTFTTSTAVAGNAYYVATNGNDGDPGTEAQPFRTLAHGVSVLTPGDTLYVMSGTYAEALMDNIPSGTSWSTPVTVAAYPGHTVTLKPNLGAERVLHFQGLQKYIVIDGLILDGTSVTYEVAKITLGGGGTAHHIRLIRCELKNAPGQGILVTQLGADFNEFIDLDVHDNGLTGYDHGLYISTSNNLVEGSTIHHNSGYGVHIYHGDPDHANNNIVRNNRIFGNGYVEGGAGIILSSGDGNTAYNNLVWGNEYGIKVAYGNPSNTTVYNNTIYANSGYGIAINTDSTNAIIRNNVIYASGWSNVYNSGVGSVIDYNLVDTDPRFANAAAGDFHLQPGSPAIDAGATLATVTSDIADIPRPRGAAYDIGAFELVP